MTSRYRGLLRHRADARAIAYVAGHFALVAAAFAIPKPHPLAAIAIASAIAFSAFVGSNVAHYALHLPVFASRPLNRAWQVLLSLTFGYPACAFVPAHNLGHHPHLQTPRDVLRTTEVRSRWNLLNLIRYAGRAGWHMAAQDLAYFRAARERSPSWFRQLIVEAAASAAFYGALAMIDWRRAVAFVAVPYLLGLRALVAYGYLQHDGVEAKSRHDHSRNFLGRAWNWTTFNSGYHGIHHLKPALHWSLLPDAHARLLAPHMHPRLDEPSIAAYIIRSFIWPGRRERFDGAPVPLPAPTPLETWVPDEAPRGVSLGAG